MVPPARAGYIVRYGARIALAHARVLQALYAQMDEGSVEARQEESQRLKRRDQGARALAAEVFRE